MTRSATPKKSPGARKARGHREQPSPPPPVATPALDAVSVGFVSGAAEIEEVREMIREYAAGLSVDLAYQGFADEVRNLPGAYKAPGGALLLARLDGAAVGCVALRPGPDGSAEIKRLFVRPAARGRGIGKVLAETILEVARSRGYEEVVLDTLPEMDEALRLYSALGFEPTEPYYESPVEGTRFLRLRL